MSINKLCPFRQNKNDLNIPRTLFGPCQESYCAMWRVKELPVLVQSGMTNAMISEGARKVGYCGLAGEIGGLVS